MLLLASLTRGWGQALETTAEVVVTGDTTVSPSLLRVGPLVPSGLLQELCHPLGSAAGSAVFQEKTGFTVDFSADRPQGFVLVPGAVGLFGQPLGGTGVECGAFLNTAPRLPCRAAGAVWLAEPSAACFGDEWFRDTPPFPGGRLAGAGGRLSIAGRLAGGLSALEAGVTVGASAGSLTPAGWLAEVDGAFSRGALEAAVLLGYCSPGYRSPAGSAAATAWRASARLRASEAESSAQLSATVDVGRPGFAPGRFIPGHGALSLQVERVLSSGGAVETCIRLSAEKGITTDAQGKVTEESRCSGRLTLSLGRIETSVVLSWSPDAGAAASARLAVDLVEWMTVDVRVTWDDHDQFCSLKAVCAIRAAEVP